jgi:hypothetical protein
MVTQTLCHLVLLSLGARWAPPTIQGQVTYYDSRLATDATVWLIDESGYRKVRLGGKTKTDGEGLFHFRRPRGAGEESLHLLVMAPDGSFGDALALDGPRSSSD